MAQSGQRKCLCCGVFFDVDHRNRNRQRYCSATLCRRSSKAASQSAWLTQPKNAAYFSDPVHVQRVQAWRAAHPGYSRAKAGKATALQDSLITQVVVFVKETSIRAQTPAPPVISALQDLYLLFLGLKMLRSGVSVAPVDKPVALASRWRLFAHTYIVTALNPKGIVFFIAFLPQFINPAADSGPQLWILAATFVVMGTAIASLYAVFATSARRVLMSSRTQRGFNLAGGTLLSGAGIWALLAKRPA